MFWSIRGGYTKDTSSTVNVGAIVARTNLIGSWLGCVSINVSNRLIACISGKSLSVYGTVPVTSLSDT